MTEDQVCTIQRYYDVTPTCEVPQWAHGLTPHHSGVENRRCDLMQWDYGLGEDIELLVRHRRAPCPFVLADGLFDVLMRRRERLAELPPIPWGTNLARPEA